MQSENNTDYKQMIAKNISFNEVEHIKSGKDAYITGYLTSNDLDLQNEIIDAGAMESIESQLKSGNIKLDIDHSSFRGEEPEVPIGRIIDAKVIKSKGKSRVWIKAKLN